jgi:putative hydrolase
VSENDFDGEFDAEAMAEFLRELLSKENGLDPEQLAQVAGLANDPKALREFIKQMQQSLKSSSGDVVGGVNWKLATEQARKLAAEGTFAVSESDRAELGAAMQIAELWLDEVTALPTTTSLPKLITRELWVGEALPLFRELSQPIASRMVDALSENLQENMPEGLLAGAGSMLRSAGGTLFAMQLGQTLGKLSREVFSGGDLGLPFFNQQREVFVPQNISEYAKGTEVAKDQLLIFIGVREAAHARLFKHAKWLRDAIVTQITQYATEIAIDTDALRDLAENINLQDAEKLREALGTGALLQPRTEEQERALAAIETMLALIEGWVEAVTEQAVRRLPSAAALGELQRRRRSGSSPAQETFGTLIGLELRPRRLREAAELWRKIEAALGTARRDALWDHPDLLPTADDIDSPDAFIERLRGGDDFDEQLRNLLG